MLGWRHLTPEFVGQGPGQQGAGQFGRFWPGRPWVSGICLFGRSAAVKAAGCLGTKSWVGTAPGGRVGIHGLGFRVQGLGV